MPKFVNPIFPWQYSANMSEYSSSRASTRLTSSLLRFSRSILYVKLVSFWIREWGVGGWWARLEFVIQVWAKVFPVRDGWFYRGIHWDCYFRVRKIIQTERDRIVAGESQKPATMWAWLAFNLERHISPCTPFGKLILWEMDAKQITSVLGGMVSSDRIVNRNFRCSFCNLNTCSFNLCICSKTSFSSLLSVTGLAFS